MRSSAIASVLLLVSGRAVAADLSVSVRTSSGAPVANAVVTVESAGDAAAPLPARFGWPSEMVQRDLQFAPFVLVVPIGGQVSFPNQDTVRHHVYSFSATKRFELKLYGKGESRSVVFEKAGAAAVGCNIHDGMVGFIKVVNTPYAAKTGASGEVTLRNTPAGPVVVRIWHPYLRGQNNEVVRRLVLPREGVTRDTVAADIRTPPVVHHSY
jgi:plastocyanin